MNILVTNNPLAEEHYRDRFRVEYLEAPMIDVLTRVRDYIHKGRRLLTHPLPGSVKPNETPYKSVLISEVHGTIDERSVCMIEECIMAVCKFQPKPIPEYCLPDLRTMDLLLLTSSEPNGEATLHALSEKC